MMKGLAIIVLLYLMNFLMIINTQDVKKTQKFNKDTETINFAIKPVVLYKITNQKKSDIEKGDFRDCVVLLLDGNGKLHTLNKNTDISIDICNNFIEGDTILY